MNTPNKLTVIRFIVSPVILLVMMLDIPYRFIISMVLFIFASITDYFDGKIAREKGIVTDFGKFLDPIADKLVTQAAFFGFLALGIGKGIVWINFLIILREFAITSMRLLAAKDGNVIAANIWGKVKTVSQMIAIPVAMFNTELICVFAKDYPHIVCPINVATSIVLWISTALTVFSGVYYLYENRKYINIKK